MNGSIASANNATLATVAANYGLKTVVDQHSLDIAARITPLEVDTKVANALLGAVTAAALASKLASRDASISGLQASKADRGLHRSLASRGASITALQGAKADATLLASYATNAALSASKTALQSALDAILAELAALQLSGSGVVNAPAWAGFTTCPSRKQRRSQPALHGSSLCCAGQRRRQDVFTTNQITSALAAYRSAADQDTATASSIAAALLSYYTIAQVDGLLANKLGVTEAASALQIAVRFPDDAGADGGRHRRADRSVVLATHTAGVSVDGYTLTLAANPWNIVRTYNLTPGRELLFACRYRLGTASIRGVHVRGRQRLRPVVRQLRGRPGGLEHG